MKFDDFEMDTTQAVFVQLNHPHTGVPLFDENGEVGVRILSADSKQFKAREAHVRNRQMELTARGKTLTAEQVDIEGDKALAECIVEIVGVEYEGAALLAPKDTPTFLLRFPWAKDQIDTAMAKRSLFMPALNKK